MAIIADITNRKSVLQAIRTSVKATVKTEGIWLLASFRTMEHAQRIADMVDSLGGLAWTEKRGKVVLKNLASNRPAKVIFSLSITEDNYIASRISLADVVAEYQTEVDALR